ncbi:CPBP family intramembrane glutamic endopeptidase [Pseudonocardia sp. CA-107938]|uniref:CPBP family intramembrane glutamic endopeptidase n=1 Tax=Pseudonocardia sp. CA-107938 TaxID=3240021 RepID=UPI003D8C4244
MTGSHWRTRIAQHPLITFFLLACGVSWLGWTPYVLSADGFGVLPFRFPELLGNTQLLGIMPGAYLGPLTAAFVVTAVTEGRAGLRRWRARLLSFRVGARWYAFALLAVPVSLVLAQLALPGGPAAFELPGLAFVPAYLLMLALQILTSGLAEEPGWRDFALHRLQQRMHPLTATLLLGTIWGAWHLPLFLTTWGGDGPVLATVGQFALLTLGISIVITWLYNRAGNSLPLVIMFHATVNTTATVVMGAFFPTLPWQSSWAPLLAVWTLAVVLVVATRGRLGLPALPTRVADHQHARSA